MKLCIDCKHCGYNQPDYSKGGYYTTATVPCFRIPPVKKVNLVNGDEFVITQLHCWMERDPIDPNTKEDICGVEGKYFEFKPK